MNRGNLMVHLHFPQIDSTQDYLQDNHKELLSKDKNVLISTDLQTCGKGRMGNSWSQLDNSLAFSFSLETNPEVTLSSLEVGVLISDYLALEHQVNIKLKWPNDLLNSNGEKCGGILCNMKEGNKLIVGVGINFGKHELDQRPKEEMKFPIGFLKADILLDQNKQKDIPAKMYDYILANRLAPCNVISKWNTYNFHKEKQVIIRDTNSEIEGKFLGISKIGAAQIKDSSGKVHNLVSGSLWNADN